MANIPQPSKKKFYKKLWFWLLIIVLLMIGGCGGGSYYSYQKMQNSSNSSLEQKATVAYKDLQKTISLEGKIKSKQEADLYFGASGKVSELHVAIGDAVDEDQLLAKITDADMATTKQKEIKAPFAGIITAVNIFENMPITAQTIAISIASEETEITASASENDVFYLKNNLQANITFSNLPDIILSATVVSVGEEKSSENNAQLSTTGTASNPGYEIILDYNKPADLNLKRDMGCDVKIIAAEKNNALAIPIAAIKWDGNQAYVNIKNGATTEKRNIKLGFEGDEYTEVLEGLKAGEEIIMFSADDLSTNSSLF